ncbi:phosphoesterase family-domain-containing protein [Gorgonomyces haynaldii]|nr:phosphoesterase family-domain-containing protein [Gorgonomyces haynaldii]
MFASLLSLSAAALPAANVASSSIESVFFVILENKNYDDVMKDNYMGKVLPTKGQLLSQTYAPTHPSLPNYMAMIAGTTFNVFDDNNHDFDGKSIVDLLEAQGKTWKTYQEDIPKPCFTGKSSGKYVRKHNPFINMKSISQNASRCANVVGFDALDADIAAGKLPNYAMVVPNNDNDGHDQDLDFMSNWLEGFMTPLLSNPVFSKTLFVITFDENDFYLGDGNRIYTLLLGPGAKPNTVDATKYSMYSQMATVEKIFGLGNLGLADATATPYSITY